MTECSNCNSKARSLLGSSLKFLDKESVRKLNDFLPESLKSDSFCEKCATYKPKVEFSHIYSRYEIYIHNLSLELENKTKELNNLNSEIEIEKGQLNYNLNDIGIFSNTPTHIELIELVESYFVVDSGMWSTSSDNLDALWSAVHDNIAREGLDSANKLAKGFETSKRFLKKKAFIKGGNTVVDVKYNFSELAGNGKILMYCQGTAGIDKNKKIPFFNDIDSKYGNKVKTLTEEIGGIEKKLSLHSLVNLANLIKSFTIAE